jgi:hypothetical protein
MANQELIVVECLLELRFGEMLSINSNVVMSWPNDLLASNTRTLNLP